MTSEDSTALATVLLDRLTTSSKKPKIIDANIDVQIYLTKPVFCAVYYQYNKNLRRQSKYRLADGELRSKFQSYYHFA